MTGLDRAYCVDLPTYAEVIQQHSEYGFRTIVIDQTKYPTLSSKRDELDRRFFARFCDRMIGYETLQLWQLKLQNKFDDIADEYERAFRIYQENATDMDKAVEGTFNTVDRELKSIDTPDSVINASDNYADSLDKGHTTAKLTVSGGRAVESVNENIDAFRDYESRFLMEFENLFSNILN